MKHYTPCSGSISKDFPIKNIKKRIRWRSKIFFSVDFNPVDTNITLDNHRYLMKEK